MDDAELVQRAASGDAEAFARVYDRYAGRLHEFLWWVLQDRAEADEALYETFVAAGSRVHELGDPARLRPWLFAVASREALHRAGRRSPVDGEPVVEPQGETSWNELVQVVRAVGEDLSARDRALLDLRFRQGFHDEDLADAIGTGPDAAAALVDRVTERVEQSLGETVVAYLGQKDCAELRVLLGEFDGRLTERQRQIVERHAQTCGICGPRLRKHVAASALLRVSPAAPLPAGLATRVLDDVDLAAHSGRPWSARRHGFPPPLALENNRRWQIAVAAGLVLLLGAGALVVTRDDGSAERVAAVGTTVAPSASTSTPRTSSTTVASTTTSTVPGEGEPSNGAAATSRGPGTTARPSGGGSGSGNGGTGGGGGGGGAVGGTSTGSSSGSTDATGTTTPATTAPPDTTGPSLSGLSVSPSVIRSGSGGCSNADPTHATVTVQASDASGIASITASFAGPGSGSYTMASSGGSSYTATIGPFESPLPPGYDFPATVIVRATDPLNNSSAATAPLTLRCQA